MDDQTNQEQFQTVEAAPQTQTPTEYAFGPRKISFLTLVLKTFAGFAGGIAGTLVLLLIFLSTSSILQPVLGQAVAVEAASGESSPLFMVVLMGMVFATSIVSSLLATLLLSYTERDRYTKIATTMSQVFIINIVIFAFVLPIYLTASTARVELTAFAAFMQIILSATASAMILELIHDHRYALMAVYTTILAILAALGVNFFIYYTTSNATIVLFAALPIIWSAIGFSQAALGMLYYWIYETWGSDFLASTASFGADYGIPDTSEEEAEEELKRPDVEGGNFFKQ
jgi:hypothetical protein